MAQTLRQQLDVALAEVRNAQAEAEQAKNDLKALQKAGGELIKQYGTGWCDPGWSDVSERLGSLGVPIEQPNFMLNVVITLKGLRETNFRWGDIPEPGDSRDLDVSTQDALAKALTEALKDVSLDIHSTGRPITIHDASIEDVETTREDD